MRPPTIAIVFSEPSFRAALARLTQSLGYRPAPFDGAETLIAALDALPLNCVVFDVPVPRTSELALLRTLNQRKPSLPAIGVAALPSEADRERTLAEGAFAFLIWPIHADELARCLAEACR
jgi:DNA-binding NtrC family response regulator